MDFTFFNKALKIGRFKFFKFLIEWNLNLYKKNLQGESCFDYLERNGVTMKDFEKINFDDDLEKNKFLKKFKNHVVIQ